MADPADLGIPLPEPPQDYTKVVDVYLQGVPMADTVIPGIDWN
tara:strand:+ start:733 stop:861 length:129 start_codon:yes stop_codon:yes gene_type:complete